MGGENMKKIKRAVSVFLCVVMMLGILPFRAGAAGGLNNFSVRRSFSEETFTDVESRDWFYDNVRTACELGLMIGDSQTTFNPNGNLTLAEAVTIAARLHSIYQTGSEGFQSGTPWYQTYVDYSKANGILPFEDLAYEKAASRAEFAEILAAALPKEALRQLNQVADGAIPDVKSGDHCAAAVYGLYRAGVLIGNDAKGTFAPDSSISRCEAAAIVSRMAVPSLRKSITLPGQSGSSSSGSTVIPNPVPDPDPEPGTTYTVTFRENAGDDQVVNMPKTQTVKAGGFAVETAAPDRDGYVFVAWCTEDGALFSFDTAINSDVVLFAQWMQIFDDEDTAPEYLYEQSLDNISLDMTEHLLYFNNIINVMTQEVLSDDEANALADLVGGKIAGRLNGAIPFLQILIPASDYATISSLIGRLSMRDEVYSAFYDIPMPASENSVQDPWKEKNTDPEETDLGNEANPGGNDWWAEAVCAYTAWDNYTQYASPIKVGIIDEPVDFTHVDLAGKAVPLYQMSNMNKQGAEHGTHVAGLIAAEHNEYGMRGVADFVGDGDLLCGVWTKQKDDYTTAEGILKIMGDMREAGVQVINMSLSINQESEKEYANGSGFFGKLLKSFGVKYSEHFEIKEKTSYETAVLAVKKLCYLIEHGEGKFLVIQSAGNGWDGNYKEGYDSTLGGYFAGITADVYADVKAETQTSVTFGELLDRFMIVGSVENKWTVDETGNRVYRGFKGSNYGSHTTIFAPGVNILSLFPNNDAIENQETHYNSCKFLDGTSMAAPIVAGAAALVWAINPALEPGEVRSILIWQTNQRAKGYGDDHLYYPMLNVGMAAQAALESVQANGTLSGKVYADSDVLTPLAGAQITVYHNGERQDVLTADSNGAYSITLPEGEYRLEITASGYETKTVVVTVKRNEETTVETFLRRRSTGSGIVEHGMCGDNLTWSVSSDGTLTISGTGEMYDYRSSDLDEDTRPDAPWKSLKNKLTRLVLEAGITRIGDNAFEFCRYLEGTLTIPGTVNEIGEGAFAHCGGFDSVRIPESLTQIRKYTFWNCFGLTALELPDSITSIGEGAFCYCSGLKSVRLPNGLKEIPEDAFSQCSGLTALEIPDSVTSIGDWAFCNCSGLTGLLVIPESVLSLGFAAFDGCSGLKSVRLPNGLKEIPDYAFSECTGLEGMVTIPAGVEEVGRQAFDGCSALEGIRFLGSAPSAWPVDEWNCQSFPKDVILYYPQGNGSWITGSAYDAAAGTWNGYRLLPWNQ